jgi:transposase
MFRAFHGLEDGGMGTKQAGYPSDVSDEEWSFVAPSLALCREDSKQREHSLRAVFNGLRYIVKAGNQWRFMPHDLPPWPAVYQQTQRWIRAGVFEILVEDLRSLPARVRGAQRQAGSYDPGQPYAPVHSESGARARYDGAKQCKGSKVHAAVDTLGHLLAGYHYFAFTSLMHANLAKLRWLTS